VIWARATFVLGDSVAVQDKFEESFREQGAPRGMMMLSVTRLTERATDIYLSVPDEPMLQLFEGFSRISESELPKSATGVVGHTDELERFHASPPHEPTAPERRRRARRKPR
jgi:hypothetical protein